ncbi:MAG: hypothetical protein AAFN78_11830 [Pseudomonadota bacterium]
MQQSKLAVFTATVAFSLSPMAASADNHEVPNITPIEIFGCNYMDGKGMDDLMRTTSRWNDWMDKEGREEYWAYILNPIMHSPEMTFDVLWVGGWSNGNSMGESMEFWINQGADQGAEFSKVVDCSVHALFATITLKPSTEPWRAGPVSFNDCHVKNNRSYEDVFDKIGEWAAYEVEQGVDSSHFAMFPAYGETSDADYSFKWVSGFDYKNFGANFEMFGNGGGWMKSEELLDDVVKCDSGRVYHAVPVRTIELEDG